MKIIVLRKNLKDGLGIISGVKSTNVNLPILKNFLIETIDNKIKLSATNLELAITCYVSGKIIEKGALTVPLDIFFNIINNLSDERINIEIKSNNIIIQTDNYEAKIQGINKDEFPIIPQIINNKSFIEISNQAVIESLNSIINSAQFSETRPELNGALFDYQINLIKLAATDSFRLSEKIIYDDKFKSPINNNFKLIIPSKTIQEAIKAFSSLPENTQAYIYFEPNQIMFKNENIEIISRLVNGEFPDYQPIIPKTTETELILNKEKLISALKLTSAFTQRLNEIKIIIKENTKNIEVYSSSQGLGENQYLIPTKIKGPTTEAVFNWRFLLDGVKPLKTESVFFGLNGGNKPALIKSPDDGSYLYILMPIKA
ncbi:MAG: DNA polymerase III subunit beta [Patescibacteria group bacterium]